jgi:hypothetical protein
MAITSLQRFTQFAHTHEGQNVNRCKRVAA